MQQPRDRPLGVTLIAILLALNGVASIIAAVGTLGPGYLGVADAAFGVLFGALLIFLAYGMWTLRLWAWYATLIIEGLNAVFALITLILAPLLASNWVSLVLAVIIIGYLLQPGVRAAFGQRPAGV